jgi:hypothetical protein
VTIHQGLLPFRDSNSLAVAQDLAVRLNGELLAIHGVPRESGNMKDGGDVGTEVRPEAESIVIVFPVYYDDR